MPTLRSLFLALAVSQTFAAPTAQNTYNVHLEKRQSLSDWPALANSVGWDGWKAIFPDWQSFTTWVQTVGKAVTTPGNFLGEPGATDVLVAWARMMGATKSTPGLMSAALDAVNCEIAAHCLIESVLTGPDGYGSIPDIPNAAPRKPAMKSRTAVPNSETIKIRYGPYKVPSMKTKNLMGQYGMLFNLPNKNLEKPCEGNCTLIGMSSGLEYADGKTANVNEGLWLHHLILFNGGPGRVDTTCKSRDVSVPHASVGAVTSNTERIFAAGNERVEGILPNMGVTDAGYKLYDTDRLSALIELMNENMEDKIVYLTMTYDIVRGHPFKDEIKIIWMDVRQCGTSEVNPPKDKPQFTLEYKWTSDLDAELVGTIGHVHDGGTHTTLSVNGEETCRNNGAYGGSPEYIQENGGGHTQPAADGAHAGPATAHAETGRMVHLSDMHVCSGKDIEIREMRKGQEWTLRAHYDFEKNKGMKAADGEWDGVMGISVVFVRVKGKD
ncbi:hypothetical protein EJ08DRAFT_658730 [Tothia fuscella]|uniref:Uncharacterized protein n=1 Tax=Tothia fuscella TaxID=1048955 RepID=A0A9P4NVZ8_9PEZI|nr:hypothetical protein EJ08DRAFT_658730 [Tothia fuscella]